MPPAKEDNRGLVAALGAAALGLVSVGVLAVVLTRKPPPPPPSATPSAAMTATAETTPATNVRYTPAFYQRVLDEDAHVFQTRTMTAEAISAPLQHTVEVSAPRTLKVGAPLETENLRLVARVEKTWAGAGSGQGYRFEHLILSIQNKTRRPLAYLVETTVDHAENCRSKGALPHNAIALAAGETVERTECLWHAGMSLGLKRAETVALPSLGYYYVSRLVPLQIGLNERTSSGHLAPASARPCSYVPWREVETGGSGWADVIDFYARHNCDEYTFFRGYHARTAPGPLPAREASPARTPTDGGG